MKHHCFLQLFESSKESSLEARQPLWTQSDSNNTVNLLIQYNRPVFFFSSAWLVNQNGEPNTSYCFIKLIENSRNCFSSSTHSHDTKSKDKVNKLTSVCANDFT